MSKNGARQQISRAIRVVRARRGWSQGDWSEKSGVARQTISELERETQDAGTDTLERLAGAAGLSLSGLLREGESQANGGEG